MENEDGIIHKEYLEKNELVIKGCRVFVNHLRLRRDIIITVIFALVIIFDVVVSLIRQSDNDKSLVNYLSIFGLLTQIAVLWFIPEILLKNIAKAYNKVQEETFVIDLYVDKHIFTTKSLEENKETVINFKDENITVIKTKDLYEIIPEISFYVIPLNIFTAEEIQLLDGMFSNALGKKFCSKKA